MIEFLIFIHNFNTSVITSRRSLPSYSLINMEGIYTKWPNPSSCIEIYSDGSPTLSDIINKIPPAD